MSSRASSRRSARAISVGWAAGAVALAVGAAMAAALALVTWTAHVGHGAAAAFGAIALAASLVASACAARGRRAGVRQVAHLDDAWELVADEVLRARGRALTAADLATAMSTQEAHAERLLSKLSVEGRVRVAVSEAADLSYQPADAAPEVDARAPGQASAEPGQRTR